MEVCIILLGVYTAASGVSRPIDHDTDTRTKGGSYNHAGILHSAHIKSPLFHTSPMIALPATVWVVPRTTINAFEQILFFCMSVYPGLYHVPQAMH